MSEKETTTEPRVADDPPYSQFGYRRRQYLVLLLGYVTLASSLTATIYFPVIELLADQFQVSIQDINLTITLYVVFQAISPALFAPLSDSFGRRPVLLITFGLYVGASLGLALNRSSYACLLVLRGLQSLGGSAVLSLAYGIVSDVITHAERGSMLGPLLAATNLGPCLGPLIGGLIALKTKSSEWCFWSLVIFGAVAFLLIGWTLPETARHIVGNGSVRAQGIWKTWLDLCHPSGLEVPDEERGATSASPPGIEETSGASCTRKVANGKGKLVVPNPLGPLRIVFYKDTFLTLWTAAVVYAVWYCIQTSIPLVYGQRYRFDDLQVGLSYIAGGVGVIIGGLAAGRLMDWNYKVVAKQSGFAGDRNRGDDMSVFPIERARSRGMILIFAIYTCEVVGLGWAIQYYAHPSIALILQFMIGAKGTIIHQCFNALLVDIFPLNPASAAAAGNITRCGLSAGLVACLNPLVMTIGYGYFFTLVGLLSGVSAVAAIVALNHKGQLWRQQRLAVERRG